MANLNQPGVRVQVMIEEDTEEGFLRDAIYYSPEEFDALTETQLKKAKKDRKDNWVNACREARLKPPEEVVEE